MRKGELTFKPYTELVTVTPFEIRFHGDHEHVEIEINGTQGRLSERSAAHLRNLLTTWVNAKRTRDIKRANAEARRSRSGAESSKGEQTRSAGSGD